MTREQMINHLTLLGWVPKLAMTAGQETGLQSEHDFVFNDGIMRSTNGVLHSRSTRPESSWDAIGDKYLQELMAFIVARDL